MKTHIKQFLRIMVRTLIRFGGKIGVLRYMYEQFLSAAMETIYAVSHNDLKLRFVAPNPLCRWRAATFSTKEPETLEWIESIPETAVLWDVGANVGLYSVFAAKKQNCKVWAFEPSVFNLELLARNIVENKLTDLICIVPIALSDQLGSSQMRMTTTEWGGALSTFGQEFGWDGQEIRKVFEYQTIGLSMDDAVDKMSISKPDYIKMDVDGLEHFILKGGTNVLKSIRGILIEVNDDFFEQADQCRQLLSEAGLSLKEKRHSELIGNSKAGFQNSYNQIWWRE